MDSVLAAFYARRLSKRVSFTKEFGDGLVFRRARLCERWPSSGRSLRIWTGILVRSLNEVIPLFVRLLSWYSELSLREVDQRVGDSVNKVTIE
jgi:hypothetical protein